MKDRSVGQILNSQFSPKSVMKKKIKNKTYQDILKELLVNLYNKWLSPQLELVILCQEILEDLKEIKPNNDNKDAVNQYIEKFFEASSKKLEEHRAGNMNHYCQDVIDFVLSEITKIKKSDDKAKSLDNLKINSIPKLKDSAYVAELKKMDLDEFLKMPEI